MRGFSRPAIDPNADVEPAGQPGRPRQYVRALVRRKNVALLAIAVVPATTLAESLRQQPVYEASARVIPTSRPFSPELQGAYSRATAARVLSEVAVPDKAPRDLLSAVTVSADENPGATDDSSSSSIGTGDVVTFTVRWDDQVLARRLANEYARQYALHRRTLDAARLKPAIAVVRRQIADARARDGAASRGLLGTRWAQLRTLRELQASSPPVVDSATSAAQVEPRLVRNLALALPLGAILGLGMALLWETLDSRFASASELARALGMPLLARLRAPPRGGRSGDSLRTWGSEEAEAFHLLRGSLEFHLGSCTLEA